MSEVVGCHDKPVSYGSLGDCDYMLLSRGSRDDHPSKITSRPCHILIGGNSNSLPADLLGSSLPFSLPLYYSLSPSTIQLSTISTILFLFSFITFINLQMLKYLQLWISLCQHLQQKKNHH